MKTLINTKKSFAYVLTLPVSITILCLLLFPLGFSILMSFMSSSTGLQKLQFVGLKNYREVISSPIFLESFKNTIIFVVVTVCTTIIIGFFIALLLNDIKRCVGIFRTLLILPLAVAPVVSGLTWGMMFNPLFGIINYLIGFLGIPPLGWATEIKTALLTIIIIDTWQWTPFVMIIIYAGLQMIPGEMYEAARIDGASRLQEIIYITIPSLKPIFIITLLFRFMDAFKSFDVFYSVTKGGPGHATETMVVKAYLESFKYHRLEIGAVIGIFLLIITFIITKQALKVLPK